MYKNFYNLIHSFKKQCHNIGFKNIYKDRIHFRGKLMKDPKHIRQNTIHSWIFITNIIEHLRIF